jgi:hypothetical protein
MPSQRCARCWGRPSEHGRAGSMLSTLKRHSQVTLSSLTWRSVLVTARRLLRTPMPVGHVYLALAPSVFPMQARLLRAPATKAPAQGPGKQWARATREAENASCQQKIRSFERGFVTGSTTCHSETMRNAGGYLRILITSPTHSPPTPTQGVPDERPAQAAAGVRRGCARSH